MGQKRKQKKAELNAKYKNAFDEIIGDPYGYPEPIEGHYSMLKSRGTISIVEPAQKSPSPVNQAKPNQLDFFCDVESVIGDGLEVYYKKQIGDALPIETLQFIFTNTYYLESGLTFSQKERAELEQIIGRILVARKISPATKYFTAIRK